MFWDDLTIGYLVALVDGEGHICSSTRVSITVASIDRDIVERAYEMSGIGCVNGPYRSKSKKLHHKEHWTWSVRKHSDVARLLLAIAPLMSGRKRETQIMPMCERLSKSINRSRNCNVCGVEYLPKKPGGGSKPAMYCSDACSTRAYRIRKLEAKCPAQA